MAKRFRNRAPHVKQVTRRGMQRFIKRTRKMVEARVNEADPVKSSCAARRRRQMLRGQLRPENGVLMQFEAMEPDFTQPLDMSEFKEADHGQD